jgi:hypothetical protein
MPKTIDYDILFPLFWLCSISSFYISKFFHENICQFYDQYFVRRYKILNYNQTKREDVRRYLFIITFVVLLLLQTLFILLPVASSIRHQHENAKVSSVNIMRDLQLSNVNVFFRRLQWLLNKQRLLKLHRRNQLRKKLLKR